MMSTHSYSLRNRFPSSVSVKTPSNSPLSKPTSRSPRKQHLLASNIQLKHVIGTTTTTPSGLTCCEATNKFAYCAGAVAVLGDVSCEGSVTYRYFKARPTAAALNFNPSHNDASSVNNTPTRRRSVFAPNKILDDSQNNSFGREWLDDATNGQTWSARERIKAATCVSLSPDGNLLAVGETGYNPRVLIFSTSSTSAADVPLSIITEHTIGVRSVAFSPDSKWLATLGDINDGFLYIWQVNSRTGEVRLQSTNKCTTNVCDMAWVGNQVVTVGTRHIKIWQVSTSTRTSPQKRVRQRMEGEKLASPGPIPLQGRNCLLGKMVDSTFTAIVASSHDMAVVSTDDGYICMLGVSDTGSSLQPLRRIQKPVAAISFRTRKSCIVWQDGDSLEEFDITAFSRSFTSNQVTSELNNTSKPRQSRRSVVRESLGLIQSKMVDVVALKCLRDWTISIDAEGRVELHQGEGNKADHHSSKVTSHRNLVKGVQVLPQHSDLGSFFTWDMDGEIKFWEADGRAIRTEKCELDQYSDDGEPGTNELRTIQYYSKTGQFIMGDRYGVLRLIDQQPWKTNQTVRAHSAEVNSVALYEPSSFLATCSRDRTVQLFSLTADGVVLLQTSDDHIAAVNQILFNNDGKRLLSCSADRTIIVRECVQREIDGRIILAFLSTRVVTLKASPLSMSLLPDDQNILAVSTMDRCVTKVDISTGTTLDSFKVTDKHTDDTAVLNSICLSSAHRNDEVSALVGYSSTDKSIRVYDLHKGMLLGRDSGHTEGISDIALMEGCQEDSFPPQRTVISTGVDGTIMLWSVYTSSQPLLTPPQELSQTQLLSPHTLENVSAKPSPASLPPLRKVLTKVEIAEFVRQTSPTRDTSPHRLRRKTSRLAMSTTIKEASEESRAEANQLFNRGKSDALEKRSPSPRPMATMQPKKQRSRTEFSKELITKRSDWLQISTSPPSEPVIASTTPKYQRANNGRLRRPPSVPSDLRNQALSRQRRRSASTIVSDLSNIDVVTEETCELLKVYGQKLKACRAEVHLDGIEKEVHAVLRLIERRREKKHAERNGGQPSTNEDGSDIQELTQMLKMTNMK